MDIKLNEHFADLHLTVWFKLKRPTFQLVSIVSIGIPNDVRINMFNLKA